MLSTREVAEKFSVSNETVRNWEKKGIITADRVSPTNRKFYSEEQINALYMRGITSGATDKANS